MPQKKKSIKDLKKDVENLFSSEQRVKSLERASEKRKEAVAKMNAASEVAPESLDIPVTL